MRSVARTAAISSPTFVSEARATAHDVGLEGQTRKARGAGIATLPPSTHPTLLGAAGRGRARVAAARGAAVGAAPALALIRVRRLYVLAVARLAGGAGHVRHRGHA